MLKCMCGGDIKKTDITVTTCQRCNTFQIIIMTYGDIIEEAVLDTEENRKDLFNKYKRFLHNADEPLFLSVLTKKGCYIDGDHAFLRIGVDKTIDAIMIDHG